jgi:ADP-ribosylglycohydrolase
MSDVNYCVQASSVFATANQTFNSVVSITTSIANITHAENNAVADSASMYVAIFR